MKRIGSRGFILVETLIVAVFIMTLFIFVYKNSVPMIGKYEHLRRYDDLDSVYAINLVRKMVTSYLSFDRIDELLSNVTYVNISDCGDTSLYTDASYCSKLKENLQIEDEDVILITRYNISEDVPSLQKSFRDIVKEDARFDSGNLSNFREYLRTVSNNESFYNPSSISNKAMGVYRLFITRSVRLADGTKQTKYANIGVYKTTYALSSVASSASLKANGTSLVLDIGENYPFTSFLKIQYTTSGGTTVCDPDNNISLGFKNQEVNCTLTEKNGNQLHAHFTVKHGYTPAFEGYEYNCGEDDCGCTENEDGTECIPNECPITCTGMMPSCYKGGDYDEETSKCLY